MPIDLALKAVQMIGSSENEQNASDNGGSTSRQRLKVCIDANVVAYTHAGDRSSFHPADAVFTIAKALSEKHVDVLSLADHESRRHPSKRATCQRKADAAKAEIQLTIARSNLQTLLSAQDVESPSEHAKNIDKAQRRVVSLENKIKRQLPPDFTQKLRDMISEYEPQGKGDLSYETAPTQADPCLAKLIIDREADALVTNDSDLPMYIGPNGTDVMISEISIRKTGEPIKECRLYTGQEATASLLGELLETELGHSPFENSTVHKNRDGYTPSYPIFSGVKDPMVRALAAMVVGCDACPKGVAGSGPKDAYELLRKHSNKSGTELHQALAHDISSMKGSSVKDKDAVLCLAESLLYEKTHDGGYVHGAPPLELGRYLEEFAADTTRIVDGPCIETCKGFNGNSHVFLAAEGISTCDVCDSKVCQFCQVNEQKELLDATTTNRYD